MAFHVNVIWSERVLHMRYHRVLRPSVSHVVRWTKIDYGGVKLHYFIQLRWSSNWGGLTGSKYRVYHSPRRSELWVFNSLCLCHGRNWNWLKAAKFSVKSQASQEVMRIQKPEYHTSPREGPQWDFLNACGNITCLSNKFYLDFYTTCVMILLHSQCYRLNGEKEINMMQHRISVADLDAYWKVRAEFRWSSPHLIWVHTYGTMVISILKKKGS